MLNQNDLKNYNLLLSQRYSLTVKMSKYEHRLSISMDGPPMSKQKLTNKLLFVKHLGVSVLSAAQYTPSQSINNIIHF